MPTAYQILAIFFGIMVYMLAMTVLMRIAVTVIEEIDRTLHPKEKGKK